MIMFLKALHIIKKGKIFQLLLLNRSQIACLNCRSDFRSSIYVFICSARNFFSKDTFSETQQFHLISKWTFGKLRAIFEIRFRLKKY
ncbi:hypothetical protein BpHYR1_018410 [Brachionus plicatilis]|uniref:Uncharacterized protein n=1 Tax=Brachionus plicatilis TaxID=10195 RepID=A0A3M7Q9R0_BRAPC|nr:hypothetical protein BpHYR1_018410 [Brachionus plicatilis]